MTSWIEPPPKQKGMGCLGKGCLLIVVFLVLLVVAFVILIRYVVTSPKPREIPQVQTSEDEQNAVIARWDEFEAASRNKQEISSVVPGVSPTPDATPALANRIELTANDINQLIARNRKVRGKAFVSIDNDVARVQVNFPLEKVGFHGRFLNGKFAVRASPDRNPQNLQITQMSLTGVPEGVLKMLLGARSLHSYADEFANEHGIATFTIEDNKVILETNGGR
jgi:cytoskeletal protein RodZ